MPSKKSAPEVDRDLEVELLEFQKRFQPDRKLRRRVLAIGQQKKKGGKCKLEAVDVDDYLTEADEGEDPNNKPLLHISRNDVVLVAGEDNGDVPYPFLACVRDIYLSPNHEGSDEDDEDEEDIPPNSGIWLTVNWIYRREELIAEAPHMHVEFQSLTHLPKADFSGTKETGILNEVFFSSSTMDVRVETVMHRCVVHFLRPDDRLPLRTVKRGKHSVKVLVPGLLCRQFYYQSGDKMFYLDESLPEDAEEYQSVLMLLIERTERALREEAPCQVLPSPSCSTGSQHERSTAHPSLDSTAGPPQEPSSTNMLAGTTSLEVTGQKRARTEEMKRPARKRTLTSPDPSTGTRTPAAISPEPHKGTALLGKEQGAGGTDADDAGMAGDEGEGGATPSPDAPLPKHIRRRKTKDRVYYEAYARIASIAPQQYFGSFKTLEEALAEQQRFTSMTLQEGLEALEAKGSSTAKLRAFMGLPEKS